MSSFTAQEREAFEALATAAQKIMHLPLLHPMQEEEYAHAIHDLQNRLMARPKHRDLIESGEATPAPEPRTVLGTMLRHQQDESTPGASIDGFDPNGDLIEPSDGYDLQGGRVL